MLFCRVILFCPLNSTKRLLILHQKMLHISKFISYKTMVKPNFLVVKPNIKHNPSIFSKKLLWINAGRCLESLALIRG